MGAYEWTFTGSESGGAPGFAGYRRRRGSSGLGDAVALVRAEGDDVLGRPSAAAIDHADASTAGSPTGITPGSAGRAPRAADSACVADRALGVCWCASPGTADR